ncbi:MAG: hypothetical protein GQ532_07190 [Methylomarinum sp.]|nr:hypothetical protein [Methylomarinum sp.]
MKMNNTSQTRKLALKLKRITTISIFLCTTTMIAIPANADQQIQDDLVVVGSICSGFDCVNGESFGFDTIRLKENNLKINFIDTSSSASFPSGDWAIKINDTANGGGNYFSIEDTDSGTVPFKIIQGAPNNSLYVSSTGNIGVNTATPAVEMHIRDGNSPAIRLHQDGSSGFAEQIWDIGGNEANFFIRDVSNGSALPFRIVPSAPNASIYIAADGDVGFETTTPDGQFDIASNANANNHAVLIAQDDFGINIDNGFTPNGVFDVQTTGGNSRLTVAADGDVGIGTFSPVGRFEVKNSANTATYFDVDATGNVGIGTNTPSAILDIENATPVMRLTSTGSGLGVWEMFVNPNTGRFNIRDQVTGNIPVKIDAGVNKNLLQLGVKAADRVDINGKLYINSVDNSTPDYVFKETYDLPSIKEHAQEMWSKSHLPYVGPGMSDNNGKAIINIANRSQGVLEELEIAHIYIEQLHKRINLMEKDKKENVIKFEEFHKKLSSLEVNLNRLETN